MEWTLPLIGMAIGLAVAAPLGPVNLLVIRYTLSHGFWPGLTAGFGAVVGDGLYAALAAFGVSAVIDVMQSHAASIELLGGLVLFALGIHTVRSHLDAGSITAPEPAGSPTPVHLFVTTLVLTVTNPATLLAFLAIFGAIGAHVAQFGGSSILAALLVVFVMAGATCWWLFLATIITKLRGRVSVAMLDRLNHISGVAIAVFGAFVLFRAAVTLAGLR
ncbi:MAG: LysE family transporter [Hyphomicrobiales bacterium]